MKLERKKNCERESKRGEGEYENERAREKYRAIEREGESVRIRAI